MNACRRIRSRASTLFIANPLSMCACPDRQPIRPHRPPEDIAALCHFTGDTRSMDAPSASLCGGRISGTADPCRFPAVSSSSPPSGLLAVGFLALLGIVGMTILARRARAGLLQRRDRGARHARRGGRAAHTRCRPSSRRSAASCSPATDLSRALRQPEGDGAAATRDLDQGARALPGHRSDGAAAHRTRDREIRRDGREHRAQERAARRRRARAVPHQPRQGADGRGERVPFRHHPRRRRAPHRRRERAARQCRDAALGLDRRRPRDRAGGGRASSSP